MGSCVKNFNEILSGFLIQLSPSIGSTYASQLKNIIKYNSILPIEQFSCHALPLRDKILNKDESYFINIENNNDEIKNDADKLTEILKLKNIYFNLDENSKSNIWDIFQALLILSEEYVTNKYIK
jgi:hypothetical protein